MRGLRVLAGLMLASGSAMAQSYPMLTGEVEGELRFDRRYKVPPGDKRLSDLSTDTEAGIGLFFTPELSIQSTLHFEPLRDPDGSRVFADQGLYLEQLYLQYEGGGISLYAGKFNTNFATGYEKLPVLFGKHEFAEDYEFKEKIGIGAGYKFEFLEYGTHELNASAFFQDSTVLSNSLFTRPASGDPFTARPKRVHRQDPLVSNTQSLESATVTLNGDEIKLLPNLSYHLGYLFEKSNDPSLKDESAFAAALQYSAKVTDDITLVPFIEAVWFDSYQGEDGHRTYLNASLTGTWKSWLAYAVWGRRWIDRPAGEADARDRLFSLGIGYDFGDGWQLVGGWKTAREEGETTRAFGAVLTYGFKF